MNSVFLKKFSPVFIAIVLLAYPAGFSFAGGSSMSWEAKGHHVSTHANDLLTDALSFNVSTYFSNPDFKIEDIRLDEVEVGCVGNDIITGTKLVLNDKVVASLPVPSHQNVVPGTDQILSVWKLSPQFVLKNNSSFNFHFEFAVKKDLIPPLQTYCAVRRVTFYDLNHQEQFYSSADGEGYVVVQNQAATITVGGKTKVQNLTLPFHEFADGLYSRKFLGSGFIVGKFTNGRKDNKGEIRFIPYGEDRLFEIYRVDKNFKDITNFSQLKKPILASIKIPQAQFERLKKRMGDQELVKIKIGDIDFDPTRPEDGESFFYPMLNAVYIP